MLIKEKTGVECCGLCGKSFSDYTGRYKLARKSYCADCWDKKAFEILSAPFLKARRCY